ncbi:nuclear transport factor 2 family protein [Rhodococcus hoagii]|nr:nuclear transport factor 2 family protein [Prescottella equi]
MTLEILLAEREITRGVVRFARAMDDRDWPVLHDIMLPDATADLGTGTLHGPGEVEAAIRSFLDDCGPTQHLLGNMLMRRRPGGRHRDQHHLRVRPASRRRRPSRPELLDARRLPHQWQLTDGAWRMSHRTSTCTAPRGRSSTRGRSRPLERRDVPG